MELRIGLEGVAIAESEISSVDGENGILIFRGEHVGDIVKNHTYEEAAYFLWNGHYPSKEELSQFQASIKKHRVLSDYIKKIIDQLPKELSIMQVVRSAVSAMEVKSDAWPPTLDQAMEIFAKVPTIIAYRYRKVKGLNLIEPKEDLDYTANYLYMLLGTPPTKDHVKALEAYLILSMDHGMNASTFTARVVTSTRENMVGAITAAIAALEGPLHGGAPSEVDVMFKEIGSLDNAEAWIRDKLEHGERLMGFGHRVYKTYDPRAMVLKEVTKAQATDDNPLFKLAHGVEQIAVRLLEEYKPGRKLYTNTEFWTACVLKTVGLPTTTYTPTFCMTRVVGWSANIIEQANNNRLIRPTSIYVGPKPKQ